MQPKLLLLAEIANSGFALQYSATLEFGQLGSGQLDSGQLDSGQFGSANRDSTKLVDRPVMELAPAAEAGWRSLMKEWQPPEMVLSAGSRFEQVAELSESP